MVLELAEELRAQGMTVLQESQGAFRIRGRTGIAISGRPDIIAMDGDGDVYVWDAKTGQPRDSDRQQMLIYIYCLSVSNNPAFASKRIFGRIRYQTGEEKQFFPEQAQGEFKDHFGFFMRLLDSDNEPARVPSAWECRFCNIGHGDCPDRLRFDGSDDLGESVAEVDFF